MTKSALLHPFAILIIITGFLLISSGCKENDDSTSISDELQIVPRDPAYAGCYPIVSTSQSNCWDAAGNLITAPVAGEAFYGQDAQYPRRQAVYTISSDGLTVKDEVTGLTWQKSFDHGIYYWAEWSVPQKLGSQMC
jgi:hypothetical protein